MTPEVVFDVRRLAGDFYTWHFESNGRITVGAGNKSAAKEAARQWVAKNARQWTLRDLGRV